MAPNASPRTRSATAAVVVVVVVVVVVLLCSPTSAQRLGEENEHYNARESWPVKYARHLQRRRAGSARAPMVVGLMATKNDALFVPVTLRALAAVVDAVVVLDDASSDATLRIVHELADECNVVEVVAKRYSFREEGKNLNTLVAHGRQLGGTHFVVLAGSEMVVSNATDGDRLRRFVATASPENLLAVQRYVAWRDAEHYLVRANDAHNTMTPLFADNRECSYRNVLLGSARVPDVLASFDVDASMLLPGIAVLDFASLSPRRHNARLANSLLTERLLVPTRSVGDLNALYADAWWPVDVIDANAAPTADTSVHTTPDDWWNRFAFTDAIDTLRAALRRGDAERTPSWEELNVARRIAMYGDALLAGLDLHGFSVSYDAVAAARATTPFAEVRPFSTAEVAQANTAKTTAADAATTQ